MTQQTDGQQEWWTAQTHAPARLPRTWWKILQTLAVVAVVGVAISWLIDPSHDAEGGAHGGLRFFSSNTAPKVVATPAPVQTLGADIDPELADDLENASSAMDDSRDSEGVYPSDISMTSYSQDPDYPVWVVTAGPDSYCLAGGTDQSSPEAYYSSDTGEVSTDPCD